MEAHQIQTKIDELEDWLYENKGHHRQLEITQNRDLLIERRNELVNEINQIKVINPEIIKP
jgi:hypothetical protein